MPKFGKFSVPQPKSSQNSVQEASLEPKKSSESRIFLHLKKSKETKQDFCKKRKKKSNYQTAQHPPPPKKGKNRVDPFYKSTIFSPLGYSPIPKPKLNTHEFRLHCIVIWQIFIHTLLKAMAFKRSIFGVVKGGYCNSNGYHSNINQCYN